MPQETLKLRLLTCDSSIGILRTPPVSLHAFIAASGKPVVSAPKSNQSPGRYAPSSACGRAPNLENATNLPGASNPRQYS